MTNYNPNGTVTRDQMATIFSRLLYGSTYDSSDNAYWYKFHIEAMKHAGFIAKVDPKIVENRSNILLILRRIATLMPHGEVKPYK